MPFRINLTKFDGFQLFLRIARHFESRRDSNLHAKVCVNSMLLNSLWMKSSIWINTSHSSRTLQYDPIWHRIKHSTFTIDAYHLNPSTNYVSVAKKSQFYFKSGQKQRKLDSFKMLDNQEK